MNGVLLTGYGGLDRLTYTDDISVPEPASDEVLVQVTAAGVNNTDVNTRTGWYSQSLNTGTTGEGGQSGFSVQDGGMGEWSSDTQFPRIQGADICGRVAFVGAGVSPALLGNRVIWDPLFVVGQSPK